VNDQEASIVFLKILGCLGLVIVALKLIREWQRKPCWLFGCQKKHLSIEKRIYTGSGSCGRGAHPLHLEKDMSPSVCYVTKWVCARPGCKGMGYWCVGEASEGAWTIQHGEIVPDEKEWSKFSK
jgi:hypothetical protein